MTVLDRPRLIVECAFATNPFVALTDERLAWIDISDSLEVGKGVNIQRRRANELDEPSAGTLSVWLDNSDGRFTRLNTAGPYYPYVKLNRLIRLRGVWPSSPANLLTQRQGTGGQALAGTDPQVGFTAPSGAVTSPSVTVTAAQTGTTTTFKCVDASAGPFEVGDVISIRPALNANAGFESGTTGWGGTGGTLTQANDQVFSGSWSGKLVPTGSNPFTFFSSGWNTYTPGRTYEASAWVRCAVARTVSLVLHWYDATSTFLSQSVTSVALPAGTWTKLELTAAAPIGAVQGPLLVSMSGTPPVTDVLWVDEASVRAVTAPDAVYSITGKSSGGGTTTFTFAPAAAAAPVPGDAITRTRAQWGTGLQLATGARLSAGTTGTTWAGPDAVPVTAGLPYTLSVWASRGAAAMSVSPRIAWYDLTGSLISETVGGTVALTTALQRLILTATAPAGARLARVSVANETSFAGSPTIGFRNATVASYQYATSVPVTVPSGVQAGDGMLLWVNLADSTRTVTTPSGWAYVTDVTDGNQRTYLFKAAATSAGATTSAEATFNVALTGTAGKVVATLAAWSGTDPTDHIHQINKSVEGGSSATHVTPNVTTTVANCWIASACFDRSTTTTTWTKPVGDTTRATVFTTGGGAATGVVSDNGAPVAAGTYGGKTFTSNTETTAATMWTIALKASPPSGDSSGTLQATGWQFEQAAAASAWSTPAQSYTRFVGHVDQWPTQWDGGTWAVANVTATDRTKLLADDSVRAAIAEQTLNGSMFEPGMPGPIAYYPLGEDSSATAAGNEAGTAQPSLPVVSVGSVTDEMLEFGGGTGPGTDAQPALKLTPASTTVGKALRGALTTPVGGDGVTEMSYAVWFNTTMTGNSLRVVAGLDDGKPTDGGAVGIFDMGINPATPYLRAHLKAGTAVDLYATQSTNYADGRTHLAVITAVLDGGVATLNLYVDGILKQTATATTALSDFPVFDRFNVGCGASDNVAYLMTGTLAHCAAWNRALSAAEAAELYAAGATGFTGDNPGDRCARLAAWKGVVTTMFEQGAPTMLAAHPTGEQPLMEAFKQVARSDGGLFFVDRSGFATLHAHGHRLGASPVFSLAAHQLDAGLAWNEDATLVANDVTVTWGPGGDSSVRVTDAASIEDYGRQRGEVATILATDTQASDRAAAYLAHYAEPISRPSEVTIEALAQPALWTALLNSEYGQKFSVTQLPTGAPAPTVDLFIEGIGEEINADSWRFVFDCSPAGFDFGLILDDPVRGLLDSNYVGW